ncbi:uncharacterized protein TNCV_1323531 [Trichonephila clavipes]|nr:uncharacterized protein TNCV_1323531 [Trichonephila clavipes]
MAPSFPNYHTTPTVEVSALGRFNVHRSPTQRDLSKIYSQFGLEIHQNDHQARRRFVEWAQNEIAVVPDFHKRILFSDEAHFWLNGYFNKQNCSICSEANPQVAVVPTRRRNMSHRSCHNRFLNDTLGDRPNFTFWTCELASRSIDLIPLDYFLWGYVKSLVYADKPQTLDHLEDNIRRVIADIRPQMLESHRKLDVQIGLHPSQPWQS